MKTKKKSLSSRGAALRRSQKRLNGSKPMTFDFTASTSDPRMREQTTMSSNSHGPEPLVSQNESGLSLRTERAWSPHGEMPDTPAFKYDPATFDKVVGYPTSKPAHNSANSFQVGGAHYKSSVQHWDYVLANHIPYLEAMVIKYLTRWRSKNGHEDIRKAHHFILKLAESEGCDLHTVPATVGAPTPGYVNQDLNDSSMAERGQFGRV